MTEKITLEEVLDRVTFRQCDDGTWLVESVKCNIWGSVYGNIYGTVYGSISGRHWMYMETPRDKLKRLIEEGADKEQLLEAFNQLENNNG